MDRIRITEGEAVSLDNCKLLWDAKEFPTSYEDDRDREARHLGLTAIDGSGSALCAGFFVGVITIGKYVLEATPRFENLDFARMFAACSEHPVVGQHLSNTLFVWPSEERWIDVQPAPWFSSTSMGKAKICACPRSRSAPTNSSSGMQR